MDGTKLHQCISHTLINPELKRKGLRYLITTLRSLDKKDKGILKLKGNVPFLVFITVGH